MYRFPKPLEIDKRSQLRSGGRRSVSRPVGKLLGEVLMTQSIEPAGRHIDAVPSVVCHALTCSRALPAPRRTATSIP